MVARTDEKLTEADSILATASEQDKRGIYPAIHRDIAYAMASQSEELCGGRPSISGSMSAWHLAVHGVLPLDIDDAYDKMVLFGDNEWVPAIPETSAAPQLAETAKGARFHPTVWSTPADLAAYDAALQASTQQIEDSFGGVLSQDPTADETKTN